MSQKIKSDKNLILREIKEYILNTDIRALVTMPPLIGFGGFFLLLFVSEIITNGKTPQSVFEIGLGIACLIECIAGFSMIIKKEMPGPLGRIITGKSAVASGFGIIVLFGLGGFFAIGYGLGRM